MTVKRAVYSWSIRFRSAGYGNEQLALLSQEYLEDLQAEGVTLRQFDAAARLVRRRSRFFPSMAEILDAVRECRGNPALMAPIDGSEARIEAHTATADNLTPEEISRNKERIAHVVAMLAREKSMEEAVEAVARCGHIEEFKGAAWES